MLLVSTGITEAESDLQFKRVHTENESVINAVFPRHHIYKATK